MNEDKVDIIYVVVQSRKVRHFLNLVFIVTVSYYYTYTGLVRNQLS